MEEMRSEQAMSQRRMLCTPLPLHPVLAHRGDGERIVMGLRPMLSRALPCTHWDLPVSDPGVKADAQRLQRSGCRAEPCSLWAKPTTNFSPSPRRAGRMSRAPVAQSAANEPNEQGRMTPKAAGDHCELRRRGAGEGVCTAYAVDSLQFRSAFLPQTQLCALIFQMRQPCYPSPTSPSGTPARGDCSP